MNALSWIKTAGVRVRLTPEGGLELNDLDALSEELYTRILEVAHFRKADIVAALKKSADQQVPLDSTDLEALARFELNPRGVVHWLAQQQIGRPALTIQRWAACIRCEASFRLKELAE